MNQNPSYVHAPARTEALDVYNDYPKNPLLESYLSSGSDLSGTPGSYSRFGHANRMLSILRDYHEGASEFLGVSENTLKAMILLLETVRPLSVKDLKIEAQGLKGRDNKIFRVYELTEDQRLLSRALRTGIELIKRNCFVITWGSPFTENENTAKYLNEAFTNLNKKRAEPITKEEFIKWNRVWIEMYVGSRTIYAHPGISRSAYQSDLDYLLDHFATKDSLKQEPRRLILSKGFREKLDEIEQIFLSLPSKQS